MSALTWEERVALAQRYAPRLILFPEKQELGRPGIEGGAGDYHPPPGAQHLPLVPQVEVLPDPVEAVSADHPARRHRQWLSFRGSWEARELGRLIAGGPTGPARKGLKWLNPFAWSETECGPDHLIY